jgi:hypothetical protein
MAADSRSICNSFALRYRTFKPDARAELLPAATTGIPRMTPELA